MQAVHESENFERETRGAPGLADVLVVGTMLADLQRRAEVLQAQTQCAKPLQRLRLDTTACETFPDGIGAGDRTRCGTRSAERSSAQAAPSTRPGRVGAVEPFAAVGVGRVVGRPVSAPSSPSTRFSFAATTYRCDR